MEALTSRAENSADLEVLAPIDNKDSVTAHADFNNFDVEAALARASAYPVRRRRVLEEGG